MGIMIKKILISLGGVVVGGGIILSVLGGNDKMYNWTYNDVQIIVNTLGDTSVIILTVPDSIRAKGKREYSKVADAKGRLFLAPKGWKWNKAEKSAEYEWEKYETVNKVDMHRLKLNTPVSLKIPDKIGADDLKLSAVVIDK